jgi:hypothetical protein
MQLNNQFVFNYMPMYLVHCVELERSLVSAIFWANPAPAALLREAGGAARKPLEL